MILTKIRPKENPENYSGTIKKYKNVNSWKTQNVYTPNETGCLRKIKYVSHSSSVRWMFSFFVLFFCCFASEKFENLNGNDRIIFNFQWMNILPWPLAVAKWSDLNLYKLKLSKKHNIAWAVNSHQSKCSWSNICCISLLPP